MMPDLTTLSPAALRLPRVLAAAAGLAFAATIGLSPPPPAIAQEQVATDGPATAKPAPALHLEDVKTPAGAPRLTVVSPTGAVAHVFPTVQLHRKFVHRFTYEGGDPPLVYHSGGSVMQPNLIIYNIYWTGGHSFPAGYTNLISRFSNDYPQHGIQNNSTQYYQVVGSTTTYIRNGGYSGGNYFDTAAYPSGHCSDSVTGKNCIIDADIQAEVKKVQSLKGWTGGLNKIFVVYTNSGEGSCMTATDGICAYSYYCAYHGYIGTSPPTIYANMPYGDPTYCQEPSTPSPNKNPAADTVLTAASHEITEAQTDPLLNAWFTASLGYEIGDLCAYDYGYFQSWDGGNANQNWNGHFYELQAEFDNQSYANSYPDGAGYGCSQVGPFQSYPSQGK
jgi:hypothetical protein